MCQEIQSESYIHEFKYQPDAGTLHQHLECCETRFYKCTSTFPLPLKDCEVQQTILRGMCFRESLTLRYIAVAFLCDNPTPCNDPVVFGAAV